MIKIIRCSFKIEFVTFEVYYEFMTIVRLQGSMGLSMIKVKFNNKCLKS